MAGSLVVRSGDCFWERGGHICVHVCSWGLFPECVGGGLVGGLAAGLAAGFWGPFAALLALGC